MHAWVRARFLALVSLTNIPGHFYLKNKFVFVSFNYRVCSVVKMEWDLQLRIYIFCSTLLYIYRLCMCLFLGCDSLNKLCKCINASITATKLVHVQHAGCFLSARLLGDQSHLLSLYTPLGDLCISHSSDQYILY